MELRCLAQPHPANAIIELSGHVDGCSTGRYAEDTALLFPSKKSIPATADTRTLFTTILAGRHHSNELDDDSGGGGNDDDEASHPSTRENDGVQPMQSSVLPTSLHTHVKADFGRQHDSQEHAGAERSFVQQHGSATAGCQNQRLHCHVPDCSQERSREATTPFNWGCAVVFLLHCVRIYLVLVTK